MERLVASRQIVRVLAVGAHADDIEIGCGGTILTLTRQRPNVHVTWVVLAAPGPRGDEARSSAEDWLRDAEAEVIVHGLRDGFLPYSGDAKDLFEELKSKIDPQLVLTHSRDDLHQDHRMVSELTLNTFRDHLILEYEIPKFDGDLGRPNVYVQISEEVAREKVALLHRHFASQAAKDWFDEDTFFGLMRLRGMESRSPSRLAEAFTGRKLVLEAAEAPRA